MRQGQQNKRMRGRGRKGPNPLARSYESNGPDVKIRGTALHVAEKYVQLARDAQSSGDRVAAENYLQHAEHYFRIVAAAQAQMPQPVGRTSDGEDADDRVSPEADRTAEESIGAQPSVGLSDPQPHVNGNGQTRADGEDANGSDERREARAPRGRRRRPYRERANGDQGDAGNGETPPASGNPEAAADVSVED